MRPKIFYRLFKLFLVSNISSIYFRGLCVIFSTNLQTLLIICLIINEIEKGIIRGDLMTKGQKSINDRGSDKPNSTSDKNSFFHVNPFCEYACDKPIQRYAIQNYFFGKKYLPVCFHLL